MSAPIVVHRCEPSGDRAVTINDEMVGRAHDDYDLIEFLHRAGLPDAETVINDPQMVEWRGGHAHHYEAA
ncbi:hypothetical protein ABZS53_14750 [Streptomyces sp. NPDC005499]|uniref:hypothetical protein n=1 Tax=Streptomyces sp. NPDC005499 TaxID=3154883 RepID=UPI0033B3C1B8